MRLNDSFLQQLKYSIDIEDIISPYVNLKRSGSILKGLCPFHNEKTASFTVYKDTQSFYCFGCGVGGDAINFISRIENLDYIDAVKLLADRAGLQMPTEGLDDSLSKTRKKILEINREAARFFHSYLISKDGKEGLDYYIKRGLTKKTIIKFGLGYAPNKWDGLLVYLKNKGYKIADIAQSGLIKKGKNNSYYDTFRNRVMTPIIDVRSNVIAFGGRVLDDSKPKYINSDDTLVYKKTNELFSLNFAKDSGSRTLILCEGYMDVISMYQAGFHNAVASCGTSLTAEQVKLVSRYADEVILAYDNDTAGQKAIDRAVKLFKNTNIKIRIPQFTGGKDPDEIIKNLGSEKFGAMLDGASNDLEFALLNARNSVSLNTTQGKVDFINKAISILSDCSPVEQDLYVSRLAEELDIEKNNIKLQLENYKRANKRAQMKKEYNNIVNDSLKRRTRSSYNSSSTEREKNAQERIISLLVKYPDCCKNVNRVDKDSFDDPVLKKAYCIILDNIDNGMDNDIMNLSQFFSDDEISRLTGIMARNGKSDNPKAEYLDCKKVIEEENRKKRDRQVSDMSDEDFKNLFKK